MSTGSKTIENLEEVNILDDKDQFLFFQNSTKKTKRITKGNMANSGGGLRGKFIDAATGNDVGITAATASSNAATALSTANGAQATANGRNRIFYQATAPTSPVGGYTLINGDLWFDNSSQANYAMYTWNTSLPGANKWEVREVADLSIARMNAGKLTAGFIGAHVIAINGTDVYNNPIGAGGYIESTSFVLTWPGANYVDVKTYNGSAVNLGKNVASDVVQVKVLQSDGSYKLYRATADQPKSISQQGPPHASYWTEITGASIPTFTVPINSSENATIQNFGFRVSSNGFAEFAGGLFRGAVIANEGYFGTASNAVRIDTTGLLIGGSGRIKSSTLTWNEGSTNPTGGTGGFFLGYRNSQYQFFIGDQSGNNLRWDGSVLKINGNLVTGTTVGSSGDGSSSYGLVLNSNYGIRHGAAGNAGIVTITAGSSNGATNGAQLELHGNGSTGNQGLVTLQAGTGSVSAIRLYTNLGVGSTTGTLRFDIDTYGTVGIPRTQSDGLVYTDDGTSGGAGCLEIDGNVGIGRISERTTVAQGKLWVANEIAVYGASNTRNIILTGSSGDVTAVQFTTSSSKKFKTNIKQLKSGIETIDKLKPVSFKRKGTKQKDIGLIAEEVDEILPVIVKHNDKNEAEGLDYSKLTVVLINAVKELSAEIKELKKKLKDAN